MTSVCLIDYGAGNLHSAFRGLERASDGSADLVISADPDVIRRSDRLVLPGVGAFASCAEGLRAQDGLEDAIKEAVTRKAKPFLGICVGMQLLASLGLEHETTTGLDIVPGTVRALKAETLRVPHMGWNEVRARGDHPLLPADEDAYFVHSYVFEAEHADDVIAETDYGERFTAAVARGNVAGAQFHPEKSGAYGLSFLSNFLKWRP
ncbi:MAG: imidazole glycerol phosphate synthase subunit HisH [Pseudomonadota bacterium]